MEREFISSKQQTPKNRSVTVYNSNRCFQNRLGSSLSGKQHGETWSYQQRTKHINVLELIAVKLAILTFTKEKSVIAVHLELGNTKAPLYLVKMGGTRSQELLQVAKEIWGYLLANLIAVTTVLTKQSEYSGRLAIQKSQRFM